MKKLFYLLLISTLCVGVVGCSESNDDNEKESEIENGPSSSSKASLIVGTWENYKDYDAAEDEYEYWEEGELLVCFKSNGTGYFIYEGERDDSFEWEIEGSWLYVYSSYYDEEEEVKIKKLNSEELVFSYDDGEYLEYYRRVK